MSTTLALRLSIHGIAYAVNVDNTITDHGFTRIICKPDDLNEHVQGRNPPGMMERRLKRAARRNGLRRRRRVAQVRNWLRNHLGVDVDALPGQQKTAVILYRERAVREVLTAPELALVLLTATKRRGWKLSPTDDDDELGDFLANVERNTEAAKEAGGIGAYQAGILRTGKRVRTRTYFRELHEDELVRMAQVQAAAHPAMQGETLARLRHIMFFQRPLRSMKHKVDRCPYEPTRRVTNRLDPYFQTFRVYADTENLRLYDAFGNDIPVGDAELAAVREVLLSGKSLTPLALLKLLGHKKGEPVSINYTKGLEGHQTRKHIPHSAHLSDAELHGVWQVLHSVKPPAAREKGIRSLTGLTPEPEWPVAVLPKTGYAAYSQKAIRRMLPHLAEGKDLRAARKLAGYGQPTDQGVELRGMNLVQKKWFDHLANHIQRLEKEHGPADRIVLASESMLLANRKKRANMARERRAEDKLLKALEQEVHDTLGPRTLSGKDRQRLLLWHECGGISPLHPERPITLAQLIDGTEDPVTVDHVVPLSRLFDDGPQNKVLCLQSVNKDKGDRTAMEYIRAMGRDEEAYVQLVDEITTPGGQHLPLGKRWRLKADQGNIPRNHVTRSLPRGSFVRASRAAWGDRVVWCPLSVPRHLLNRWDFELLPGHLDNHISQAWALSVITSEYLERLDTLTDHPGEHGRHLQPPAAGGVEARIRLHHYRRSSFRGKGGRMEPKVSLHRETHYGTIAPEKWMEQRKAKGLEVLEQRGTLVRVRTPEVVVRYAVHGLTAKDIQYVVDPQLRQVLVDHLAKYGNNAEKAWANYEEDPPMIFGSAVRHVRLFTGLKQTRAIRNGQYLVQESILDHTAVYSDEAGALSFVSHSPLDVCDALRKREPMPPPVLEGKGSLLRTVRYGDVFEHNGEPHFVNAMERDTGRVGLLPVMRPVPVAQAVPVNLRKLVEPEMLEA